ncbi:galactose-specific lectin nattectin-like [Ptychodera flava]|uniref:galactose-specific lectin nattectin-like n=1 Tax=Ptychodera flava TaxID=63121 RepID=UPI00396A59CB
MRVQILVVLAVLAVSSAAVETELAVDKAPAVEETSDIKAEEEFQAVDEADFDEADMEESEDLKEEDIEEEDLEERSAEDAEMEALNNEDVEEVLKRSSIELETEQRSDDDENNINTENIHKRWVCYGRNGCYLVFCQHYNWKTARRVCRAYRGELASIHNSYQRAVIYALARRFGNLWIGLNDIAREMQYRWSDRSKINYGWWQPGEPNDYCNREDCVEVYRNGHWNDARCYYRRRFVCRRRWHHRYYWG